MEEAQASGLILTQDDKDRIVKQARESAPVPEAPAVPTSRKWTFLLTLEEWDIVNMALGEHSARALEDLCRAEIERRNAT